MESKLEKILEEIRRETSDPAIACIVVSHDSIIADAAIGIRQLDNEDQITIEDKFHVGSNTKAITATLCASTIDRKLLGWQTTILNVFPELDGKILPEYETITLEMLLKHMAGIQPYMDDEADDYVLPEFEGMEDEKQITHFSKWLLREREPINKPGTEFSYSNAGYSIAAAMVEAVTRKSWQESLEDDLFVPLEIEAMVAKGWPALHDPNQPWGHQVDNGKILPHPPNDEYQLDICLAPAGDVSMSLPNYGKFLQMHLKGLIGEETIIPNELIRQMHNNGEVGNGMGWGVVRLRSMEELGVFSTHAGSAGTFNVVAGISHEHDIAVALATNSGNPKTLPGIKKVIAAFIG